MKIVRHEKQVEISELVKQAKKQLLSNRIYVLDSADHAEHIAAYIAWNEIGGNIFVKSPFVPVEQQSELEKRLSQLDVSHSVVFHTSGTTGTPKLVVHKQKQFQEAIKLSTDAVGWNHNTRFLNFVPAFVSGFWHIVIPALVQSQSSIYLGSRNTMISDLSLDVDLTILIPAMLDFLKSTGKKIDFSGYEKIITGASPVSERHAEFVFNMNGNCVVNLYGTTETCSPLLKRQTEKSDSFVGSLEINNRVKLVDGELWVRGDSLCENYRDFSHQGEWFRTGDYWVENNNLICFSGRKSEIVKINGYKTSLFQVESVTEENSDLGDTLAVVRNSAGSEWIELFYTNKNANIDKKQYKSILQEKLPYYSIPRKFTHTDEIPRNALGKKLRTSNL